MSRIPKWKVEKTKVKVVFRLQLHATHTPHQGWDKLFVSFIPADTGKATAKTTKANVRNGSCKWSDPIYETTRLLLDARSKKYDEKLYKLVVAMGSSRSSLLGEVIINLADYADALKPSSVALPLHGCDFGTILHVTIQLLTSKTGFREFEQQRELSEKGFRMIPGQKSREPSETSAGSSEVEREQMDKQVSARTRFRADSAELPPFEEVGELNEANEDSAAGIDGSSYTSESLHAEKNDILSTHEVDSLMSANSGDGGGFTLGQSPCPEKECQNNKRLWAQGSNDWAHGWNSDLSMDNDLATVYEDNNRLRVKLGVAESTILQLKLEANSLMAFADQFGMEMQTLAEQLGSELASGQKLTTEVLSLKSECSKLKNDFEELNFGRLMQEIPSQKASFPGMNLGDCSVYGKFVDHAFKADQDVLLHDFPVNCLQGLSMIEGQIRQIQNKSCHGCDINILQPDFEVLDCLLENLKQCIIQTVTLEPVDGTQMDGEMQMAGFLQSECLGRAHALERSYRDVLHPDRLRHVNSSHQVHHQHEPVQNKENVAILVDDKLRELMHELEKSNTEKECLTKKMVEMECYYEALIQQIEDNQKQTLNELGIVKTEHAGCLYTISELQTQIDKMHRDRKEEFLRFAEDRHSLDILNEELERRAVASETALKRVRWNYSIAIDRLQKDLELLSFQVLSMYETNENLTKQALMDASQPPSHVSSEKHLEEAELSFHKRGQSVPTGTRIQETVSGESDHPFGRNLNGIHKICSKPTQGEYNSILRQGCPKNVKLQTEDVPNNSNEPKLEKYETIAAEYGVQKRLLAHAELKPEMGINSKLIEKPAMLELNVHPQTSNHVGTLGSRNQCAKTDQLMDEGKNISFSLVKELLSDTETELAEMHMLNLYQEVFSEVLRQTLLDADDGIRSMTDKTDELVQQLEHSSELNEALVLKLQSAWDEARAFGEGEAKIRSRCDDLMLKNHWLEAQVQAALDENNCLTEERKDIENLLKKESLEKSCLQTEFNSLMEDYKAVKEDFNKQSSLNNELQSTVTHLQEKLGSLCLSMVYCCEHINGSAIDGVTLQQKLESKNYLAVLLQLEQFQQEVCKNISQLRQEKNETEQQRNAAEYQLKNLEAQISFMNKKFDSDQEDISEKLYLANTLVEKLQLELREITDKLKLASEAGEKQEVRNRELVSKLVILEAQLKYGNDEKMNLVKELEASKGVYEELEKAKLNLTNCLLENKALMMSVQSGNEESIRKEHELLEVMQKLKIASQTEEKQTVEKKELFSKILILETELQQASDEKLYLVKQLERLKSVGEELERTKLNLASCLQENKNLMISIQTGHEVSMKKDNELINLQDILTYTQEKLQFERGFREELEASVSDLKSQLKEKNCELLSLDEQKSELAHLRQEVSELESGKSELQHLLSLSKKCQMKLDGETSCLRVQLADLEYVLVEHSLVADVEVTYTRYHFRSLMQTLIDCFKKAERELEELQLDHQDSLISLNKCMASRSMLDDENAELSTTLQSFKAEFESVVRERETLLDSLDKKSSIWTGAENLTGAKKFSASAAIAEADCSREGRSYEDEICYLKGMLVQFEEEVENIRSSRDELEITNIVLQSKLDEQRTEMSLLKECDAEHKKLQEQHSELTYKLSEQVLKTEEFKNLSIHLRELKDKADAECNQAREKKDSEGSSPAIQESLRMAFIKEQCETKLQELRNQLFVSKKHAEELLLKFQDAADELESGKKREVTLSKRNEELSTKVSGLETELERILTHRKELLKACDRMKAELECTILSLDCCKEEKLKIEESLQECNEDRTKIRVELDLVKRLLENMISTANISRERNDKPDNSYTTSIGQILEGGKSEFSDAHQNSAFTGDTYFQKDAQYAMPAGPASNAEKYSISCEGLQNVKVAPNGLSVTSSKEPEGLFENNAKNIAEIKEHFKEQQRLKAEMDQLNKELERLRNDNLASLVPLEDHHLDQALQGLERDLSQLERANEHLGSIFPFFKEFPGTGSALERVLALELELAESLQAKKKPEIRFQSSFLKQHNDEEAVFQSFRDINELIKDMLDLKRKNAAVENELNDMQGRYSQLSLQFAEVEGERQKLLMSLKSRIPKKSG